MANERPLDETALRRLREDLAAGKRPSLVLLSGGAGLAPGSRGRLLRIDDPPRDAEFLHVRVGNDELPFGPEELALPGRRSRSAGRSEEPGSTNGSPATGKARSPSASTSEPILEPVRPDRRTRSIRVTAPPSAPAEPAVPESVDARLAGAGSAGSESAGSGSSGSGPAASEPSDALPAAAAPAVSATNGSTRRPRRSRPAGSPPKMALTLRFADFGWTVETLVAGRRDKAAPVPLAAVRAFADQLEDQALRRHLESTVEACRGEAEKRAQALRAELARLETELAALED
jgi:hypothetical protein